MSNENIFNNKIRFCIEMRRKYPNSENHPRLFSQLFNIITALVFFEEEKNVL